MIKETKQERANIALQVLTKNKGVKKTISEWMEEINHHIPKQNNFKNTKELAQTFRYIKLILKQNIIKSKEATCWENFKNYQVFYTLLI